tara:strand:- start:5770 stop:6078 length:309 start_codon:yes stop_codon:yes gene_type:complete
MRRKAIKKINKKAEELLLEWLKTLVSEEESKGMTPDNFRNFLPKDRHFVAQRTFYLSFYTVRWTKQTIKKLLKKGKSLENITLGDLEWILKKRKSNTPLNTL